MKYYEIEFANDYWICIHGLKEPTLEEANEFLKTDVERIGFPVTGVYPIEEVEARAFYDFSMENHWPVFGQED